MPGKAFGAIGRMIRGMRRPLKMVMIH